MRFLVHLLLVLHDGDVSAALLREARGVEALAVARHVVRERVRRVLRHADRRRGHGGWQKRSRRRVRRKAVAIIRARGRLGWRNDGWLGAVVCAWCRRRRGRRVRVVVHCAQAVLARLGRATYGGWHVVTNSDLLLSTNQAAVTQRV